MHDLENLYKIWTRLLGSPAPKHAQFYYWLRYHTAETIEQAIVRTSERAKRGDMSLDYKIRYCSRCANDTTFAAYEKSKQTSSEAM